MLKGERPLGMFRRARERTPEVARMLEKDGFVIQTARIGACTSAYNLKPNRLSSAWYSDTPLRRDGVHVTVQIKALSARSRIWENDAGRITRRLVIVSVQ